ncbi:50S ribosomal protein L10 [Blattabacterium cuenoti]|uniref:50S ribosomal protein L10 n=1 Tax=Blattabacterium cuenoti TaxID=1653831 RepID=UPI00163B839E|nr:50S ribosomal protein L10 [Blattabacterium cuenoti]
MNKKNKKKELLELVSLLSNIETIYLIDISNLNCNQISVLRKNFHEQNIQMKVVKNTLLRKAMEKNDKFYSFFSILNGNTTILFSNKMKENIASKIIKNFHIQEKIDKPYLKGAYIQKSFYFGNESLDLIINIKSKEDIIANILYTLQFPMIHIILSLSNIYGILNALSSQNKINISK